MAEYIDGFNLVEKNEETVKGWVADSECLARVLEAHSIDTGCQFVSWHDDRKKKEGEEYNGRFLWKHKDIPLGEEQPFKLGRHIIKQCQYGRQHKRTQRSKETSNMHNYAKGKRFHIQPSRKVGCTAKIVIRYVRVYVGDQFNAEGLKEKSRKRQLILQNLRDEILQSSAHTEERIFISLPFGKAHTEHEIKPETCLGNRLNRNVQSKIHELVSKGITNVSVVRRIIQVFVETEFSDKDVRPSPFDRAFYPLTKDLKNHIHSALTAGQLADLDQDNLREKMKAWQKEDTDRKIYYRPATEPRDSSEGPDSFLFIHQESWQRSLLEMYGNTMTLLDATYRTTKYALPFFMLVVKTNVEYIPVAEFVTEDETIDSIKEALEILKCWNPGWDPAYVMVDYSEAEINAVNDVFRQSSVNIMVCAFHREQAWERWSRNEKNIRKEDRDDFLTKMRNLAYALDEDSFSVAEAALRGSQWFRDSVAVQRYIDNKWLSVKEYWCSSLMDIGFQRTVTTTNGVETLNKSLKHFYLKLTTSGSLTNMLEVVIKDFLPDLFKNYVMLNSRSSSNFKAYDTSIPDYLHNRPCSVVKHCMIKLSKSKEFREQDISLEESGDYYVKSSNNRYSLRFGTDSEYPFCSCADFRRTFLPCKHFFAVISNTDKTWSNLGSLYLKSPYLNIDLDTLQKYKPGNSDASKEGPEDTGSVVSENSHSTCISPHPDEQEECPTFSHSDSQKKEPSTNQSMQREVVARLKCLQSLVYICHDNSVLQCAKEKLLEVEKTLKASVDRETGLPIQNVQTLKLRRLPSRKKYFKKLGRFSRRVGKKAKTMRDATDIAIESNPGSKQSSKGKKGRLSEGFQQKKENNIDIEDNHSGCDPAPSTSFNVDEYTQNEIKKVTNVEEDDIQAMEAVNMLWSLDRDCNIPVAKVNDMKISDTDIRSLRPNEWLTDMAMDSYLSVLATIQNDIGGKVIHYVQTKMTSIINGRHTVRKPRDGTPRTIPELGADKIIGTYHTAGHWSLVIIEVQNGRIFYYNPTGERWTVMNKIERNWKRYIHDIQEAFGVRFRTSEWTVNKNPHTRQTDGCNCGVYCLMFAEKHLSGNFSGLTRITDSDIIETRQKVAKDLMLYEVFLDGCCPKCGFDIEDDQITIECKSCARGFHFLSYCIEEDLKDLGEHSDFVCKLCRINFWNRRPVASKTRKTTETTKQRINEHDSETVEKDKMPSSKKSKMGEIHFTSREGLRKDRKKRKRSSFLCETPKKKSRPRFCICNKPDDGRKYWLCDKCNMWFHPTCLGLKEDVEPEFFHCKSCQVIQINSDEDTADVRFKKPSGAFSDNSSGDDFDEGTNKDKIDYTFIESKSSQVQQLLKDILSCDNNNDCDEHSHIRHHEFTRNSVIFSIRSKRKCSYGTDYFKTKTIEDLQKKLINEYLYSISDPKYPVSGAKISLIRNVQEGTALYALLTDKKLIALDYICLVLAKEVLTLLVALKSGMPLELADEKCKATEIDMRRKAR